MLGKSLVALAGAAALLLLVHRSRKRDETSARVLRYLAWRHERLAHYDPAWRAIAMGVRPLVDALIVHGSSFVACPLGAADLFVDVLYPAGCRTVLLTGGVGRETPPLWTELVDRGLTGLFSTQPWSREHPPHEVELRSQRVRKPVLDGVDLQMAPEALRQYASEADVFLELFVSRCRERGLLDVVFGGNPMAEEGRAGRAPQRAGGGAAHGATARVYLETASTHTGTNVEYSRQTLAMLGLGTCPTLAVVQQPQLQLRTCCTWEKQTGARPLGWTVRPSPGATGRSTVEMLRYALGELKRLPPYAAPDKGFCTMPADFPHELVPTMLRGQRETI